MKNYTFSIASSKSSSLLLLVLSLLFIFTGCNDSKSTSSNTVKSPMVPMVWYNDGSQPNANWNTVENWWLDSAHTKAAGRLPHDGDYILLIGNQPPYAGPDSPLFVAGLDASGLASALDVYCIAPGGINNDCTVTGNITIASGGTLAMGVPSDSSSYPQSWGGTVYDSSASVLFQGRSFNQSNLPGDVIFNGSSSNSKTVTVSGTITWGAGNPNAPCIFGGGSGTSDSPYLIATSGQLICLASTRGEYDWGRNFRLNADINLSSLELGQIGTGSGFSGVFDGNGKTISHLASAVPIFETVTGTIKNLILDHFEITGEVDGTSALASSNQGTIQNVRLQNSTITINLNVFSQSSGIYTSAAGLVLNNSGFISDSEVVNTNVTGSKQVGALVSYNLGTIQRSRSDNCVIQGYWFIGGFVGGNTGNIYDSSSRSMNIGYWNDLTGRADPDYWGTPVGYGGFVGFNGGTIEDAYSTGTISGVKETVGGFAGYTYNGGLINRTYADVVISPLEGYSDVGSFVGQQGDALSTIANSYINSSINQDLSPVGSDYGTTNILLLNSSEMIQQSSFGQFNFTEHWKMPSGISGSPILQWE